MSTWETIRWIRTDMSQYLMHCTKDKRDEVGHVLMPAYDVLKKILAEGCLRATFAPMTSQLTGKVSITVRGPTPAVCFTEQPLQFFLQTIQATPGDRYTQFAVAVRKDDLFDYGGRPVIYDNNSVVDKLPEDQQYRWVGYDPTVMWLGGRDYPIDWTHEREWRTRPNSTANYRTGIHQDESDLVPVKLPTGRPDRHASARFALLVDTEDRKRELTDWIASNVNTIRAGGKYLEEYAAELERAQIVSFEHVASTKDGNIGGQRLEDIISAMAEPIEF